MGARVEQAVKARDLAAVGSFFFDDILLRTTRTHHWRLWEALYYYSATYRAVFEVEPGFQTDLASLPRTARVLFDRNGPGKLPAILHDRGYDSAGVLCVYRVPNLAQLEAYVRDYEAYRSLVHSEGLDTVLQTLVLDRKAVDLLFLEAMGASGVGRFEQLSFYHAVRLGGGRRFGKRSVSDAA